MLAVCGVVRLIEITCSASDFGLPANAPARPADPIAYPAVHDVPPPRTAITLTDVEQQKLENDLVNAREQQQTSAGVPSYKKTQAAAAKAQAPKSAKSQSAKVQADRAQGYADPNAQGYTEPSTDNAPISASSSRTIY